MIIPVGPYIDFPWVCRPSFIIRDKVNERQKIKIVDLRFSPFKQTHPRDPHQIDRMLFINKSQKFC